MTVPLLMDVDTGVDDAVALLYAVATPRAELVAATCSAGNVPAPQAAANTRAVLDLAGATDVEVAQGALAPLVEPLRTAVSHGSTGLGYADLVPEGRISGRFAADVIVENARARPGELLLVVTGPQTNLALALRREPELPRLLRRLALMGGSFDHPGNSTPTAEFNILVDPEAAAIVFDAFSAPGVPRPLVCGLNVTERAELRPEHVRRVAELAGSEPAETLDPADGAGARPRASKPLVRFLSDALRFKFETLLSWGVGYLGHMHDPLALALALDASLGETRAGTVDVELAGRLTRGMTVVDWAGHWKRPANADVAVEIDFGRFTDELVGALAGLARRTA